MSAILSEGSSIFCSMSEQFIQAEATSVLYSAQFGEVISLCRGDGVVSCSVFEVDDA